MVVSFGMVGVIRASSVVARVRFGQTDRYGYTWHGHLPTFLEEVALFNELSGEDVVPGEPDDDRVVLSSIHHRDQARLYAKQVHNGQGEIDLSPEEAEAVRLALSEPPTQEPAAEHA